MGGRQRAGRSFPAFSRSGGDRFPRPGQYSFVTEGRMAGSALVGESLTHRTATGQPGLRDLTDRAVSGQPYAI